MLLNKRRIKIHQKTLFLVFIIVLMSILMIFPANNPDLISNSEDFDSQGMVKTDLEPFKQKGDPITSAIGQDPWWNTSFRSRQLINITNPNSVSLYNYPASISFNYTKLVSEGKMNESLKDVRIVEYKDSVAYLRKYYFKMDYPQNDIVTVWFDTNVSAGSTEYDTYLYYGKNDAEINDQGDYFTDIASNYPSDSFGWIRNGNFEIDNKTGTLINNTFGWNWTDDVPYDLAASYIPNTPPGPGYQHNLSIYTGQHEQVYEGAFSFKWGDKSHIVATDASGSGDEYIGTLYSHPFIVPKVSSGGKVYIRAWRNIRVYDKQNSKQIIYYARICKDYGHNFNSPGTHTVLPNGYLDYWQSIGTNTNNKETNMLDPQTSAEKNTNYGQITDVVYIDVTNYQGQLIFIEFGMYGQESNKMSAFGQVDDIRFNYTINTALNTEEERRSDVTIITRDVDGRVVPNAEVSLVNSTGSSFQIKKQGNTSDDGSITFTGVDYGDYNITVNYTLPDKKIVVYDSRILDGQVVIQEAIEEIILQIYIWTIDFEIVDSSKEPLNYGFVNIINKSSSTSLQNLTLDNEGKATFRGLNISYYNYEIYYDNDDYNLNPTKLNESDISRQDYAGLNREKYQNHTIHVNNTNKATGSRYSIDEWIYTNGSRTLLGNKKILKANITLTNMKNYLDDVSIYYVDKDNSTIGNLLYFNDTYTISDDNDRIEIDIRFPPETGNNLEADSYEVYGLRIVVNGQNTTQCNGLIQIDLFETCNIYNITALSKINIRIIDDIGDPVIGCKVLVNGTNRDGRFLLAELITKEGGNGYAFGKNNSDLPFWYLNGFTYNFSLIFFGSHKDINVSKAEPQPTGWNPKGFVSYYFNYTLNQESNLTFKPTIGGGITFNTSNYKTKFDNFPLPDYVTWGQNLTVQVNFTSTTDNWETIPPNPVVDPEYIICTLISTGIGSRVYFELDMNPGVGGGNFNVTFNSSRLSAGGYGKIYSILISGIKIGYSAPNNISDLILINPVSTSLSLHDYYSSYSQITEDSQKFGELLNMSFRYSDDQGTPLKGATLNYEWLSRPAVQFFADSKNQNYYTTTIDTSLAETVGTRSINVIASLENYSTQSFLTNIIIEKRPTKLNDESDLVYISKKVWVEDEYHFTYTYTDTLASTITSNLDVATYTWQEIDEEGNIINETGDSGTLTQNNDSTYDLDFDTETKPVGFYYLYIVLAKENYEERASLINLEVELREFKAALSATNLNSSQINVVKGNDINFKISLDDLSRHDIPLQGATVILTVGGKEYKFKEVQPGVYTYTFSTDEIDAFFTSQTNAGNITIEKTNFTSQTIKITIIIEMEQIFDGMPAFYFIMLVGSISGVAGSLISYRIVQQARIPKLIKKMRAMKNAIQTNKLISDAISVPTKEETIIKHFDNEFKEIGISLKDVLGIKELKSKPMPDIEPLNDNKGGAV